MDPILAVIAIFGLLFALLAGLILEYYALYIGFFNNHWSEQHSFTIANTGKEHLFYLDQNEQLTLIFPGHEHEILLPDQAAKLYLHANGINRIYTMGKYFQSGIYQNNKVTLNNGPVYQISPAQSLNTYHIYAHKRVVARVAYIPSGTQVRGEVVCKHHLFTPQELALLISLLPPAWPGKV